MWSSRDGLSLNLGSDTDVLHSQSSDNGFTWTDPLPLTERMMLDRSDGLSEDLVPNIHTDGKGLWLVMWESNDDLGGLLPGLPDVDIFYSISTDNGATWTDSTPMNTNAATDNGLDGHPILETDGKGNWIVVWTGNDPAFGGGGSVFGEYDIAFSRAFFKNAVPAPVWKMYR